jgi:hypothetical protein
MLLPNNFADAYTDERVRTLLHETFHAVDARIIDHVYARDPSFAALGITEKLTNADHYADVARTHAGLQPAIPPTLTVATADGVVLTEPEETKVRDAVRNASARLTRAWVRSLWDWQFMGRIGLYVSADNADDLVLRRLRRISELTGLTLHQQSSADTGAMAAAMKTGRSTVTALVMRPFPKLTEYDQAVLEEVVADTHQLVSWIHGQSPITVTAGAATGASTAWLPAAAVKDPNMHATGLALNLVKQAVLALRSPWLSSNELVAVIEALRVEASV